MLILSLHLFHADNLHGDLHGKIKAPAPASLHTTFFFIVRKLEVRHRSRQSRHGARPPRWKFWQTALAAPPATLWSAVIKNAHGSRKGCTQLHISALLLKTLCHWLDELALVGANIRRSFEIPFQIWSNPCRDQGSNTALRQVLWVRFDSKSRPGFQPSHPHDTGPGPHAASRATGETPSSPKGISEQKKDPRVPCSLGSKGKSKPNFKPKSKRHE